MNKRLVENLDGHHRPDPVSALTKRALECLDEMLPDTLPETSASDMRSVTEFYQDYIVLVRTSK